ncbi:pyridoxal-dependent decarboxylase [Streptomyces nanshensis]|uniref:pyridoxal-dependent decarboxylase n=1 Tax=Streptomyces nanshensis TaxID=518642 RepID=UPI00085BEB85|nr:pyridoxal-dependent decarboxylase [Streptomyces nanshensis]
MTTAARNDHPGPAAHAAAGSTTYAISEDPRDPDADAAHLLEAAGQHQHTTCGQARKATWNLSALAPLLSACFNHTADPAAPRRGIDAQAYEEALVRYFTETAGARPQDTVGHLTASATDGVLWGLATARQRLPRAWAYASDQAHPHVATAASLLSLPLVTVPSTPDGRMDPQALEHLVRARRRRHNGRSHGAIVVATTGTPFRGAYDDLAALREAAEAAGEIHVHGDAALGGLTAAYAPSRPRWQFEHGADSLSLTGHTLVGSPLPCGAALARTEFAPAGSARGRDLHLNSGSGLAAVLLWARLRQLGHQGVRELVQHALEIAQYLTEELTPLRARPTRGLDAFTVVVRRPPPHLVSKYHLICHGDYARILATPEMTRAAVNAFCAEYRPANPLPAARTRRP